MTETTTQSSYSAGEPAELDLTLLRQLANWGRAQAADPVGEIVRLFLDRTPVRLAELSLAMHQSDATAVERAAHALSGGCGQVGARHMAHLAAFVETEAQGGITTNFHIARILMREFETVRALLCREFLTPSEPTCA